MYRKIEELFFEGQVVAESINNLVYAGLAYAQFGNNYTVENDNLKELYDDLGSEHIAREDIVRSGSIEKVEEVADTKGINVNEVQVEGVNETKTVEVRESKRVDILSKDIIFESSTKSRSKLAGQMAKRGWTKELIKDTVDNYYTKRVSYNKANGNKATAFYTEEGAYVVIDDITKEVIQVGNRINPREWRPDPSIIDPYIYDKK